MNLLEEVLRVIDKHGWRLDSEGWVEFLEQLAEEIGSKLAAARGRAGGDETDAD